LFAWQGMKAMVHSFVTACEVCQQAKPDRSKLPGLLQPLPVPDRAWSVVSLDFIEGLPTSGGVSCILVVVDLFSKYAHFIGLKHPFTAASVAQAFLSNVYRLHGLPQALVSDRDRVFTSNFWRELFKLAGVELRLSTAYHPQSDGQTERVNQCLETFLRCFVHTCPRQWHKWLDQAEFWYNTSWHSALNRSPFEVLYGYSPRQFGISVASDQPVTDLSSWLADRELMTDVIRLHLNRAKQRMKRYADAKRSERQFQIGDHVYVKIQPYVQASLAQRSNQKLAFKFFGPYRVTARVGSVAYRLELPASSSVHPVFHVSQLKKAVSSRHSVTAVPPSEDVLWSVPERILQHRSITKGTHSILQGLIKWSNLPISLATWEDLEYLRQQFPRASVWSRPGAQGGGDVTASTSSTIHHPARPENADGPQPRRSSRPKMPSKLLAGEEWRTA
jgi:transposase InsO family protein